ncbi:MAG: TRAP transporter large permease [Methyloligellaceae bacterium]
MDGSIIALIGFLALFFLLFIRLPVGLAMMLVGTAGIYFIREQAAIPKLAGEIFNEASNFPLTIIPLFVLMGNLAGVSGMSRDLYDAAHSWLGHLKGGLASATVVGCAGFSALSGSSLAAAITMGRVALPEMQRHKYHNGLATGSIAAGGTLGILIPPSAGFVIYAILTEESIGRLFLAGVLPGLMLTLLFIVAIWIVVALNPEKAPQSASAEPWGDKFRTLLRAGWIIGIIVLTIGGIYTGVFSAVEAAGIGAALAFVVTIIRGALTWSNMMSVFNGTLKASGTLFLILFGAFVFKTFIGFTGLTLTLAQWVEAQNFSGLEIVIAFLIMFIVLGTFMEGFAILVLTVPLIQPIIEPLGIDMIWFGVLMVICLEMGLISPPVGVNVFVVKGIAQGVPLNTIFAGIWPFWFAMLASVIFLIIFPDIALLLPNTMFGQ